MDDLIRGPDQIRHEDIPDRHIESTREARSIVDRAVDLDRILGKLNEHLKKTRAYTHAHTHHG